MVQLAMAIRVLGVSLILAVVATACGQPAAPSPAATKPAATGVEPTARSAALATQPATVTRPAAPPPAQLTKVRVGDIASTMTGFYIAADKGYFKEQGLDVELTNFSSGSDMVAPLAAGQLDVGSGGPGVGLFNALARGIDLKIVAAKSRTSQGGGYEATVVRKDLWDSGQVRSFADLKGRKVAMSNLTGTTSEVSLDLGMLQEGGLRARNDADLVQLKFGDMPAALANKAIDAAVLIEPFVTKVVEDNIATILARHDKISPNHETAVVFYSSNFAKEHPDVGKRFMVAYLKAMRDYNDAFIRNDAKQKKEIVDIMIKNTSVKDAALYDRMVMPGTNPDGYVNIDSLIADQDYYIEAGLQKEKINMADLVDQSFAQAAVKQLGLYK